MQSSSVSHANASCDPFVFGPHTEMWRINRERTGLIYGPAAAVLQVAHPRIAQGVHDHSRFQTDSLGRLHRTLAATNAIAFGSMTEAVSMKERLAAAHERVRGRTKPGVPGPLEYSAFEPDLMFWVLATLIHAAMAGYEFVYGPQTMSSKEAFYLDMCRFGEYFGADLRIAPRDWAEFEVYYREMIDGPVLGSHPLCAQVAQAVAAPNDSPFAWVLGRLFGFIPIETLPPAVRERLGLRSTTFTRTAMRLLRCVLPPLFPRLPPALRFYPEYRQAAARLRRSGG